MPGFGRLGSWRLPLPSTWHVASNTKELDEGNMAAAWQLVQLGDLQQ